MATWEDVRQIVLSLPEVSEETSYGRPAFTVKKALFVWDRPLGKKDRADLGDDVPEGLVLGARVPDEGAKQALVAEGGPYFTVPHFTGYPAILVRLDEIAVDELTELVTEAWLCRAPKRVAAAYLADRG